MENHLINIDNRQKITVTDVGDVDSFNEETIAITLKKGGGLVLRGQNLHIQKLDLGEGKVIIAGEINSLAYTQKKNKDQEGFWKKILK